MNLLQAPENKGTRIAPYQLDNCGTVITANSSGATHSLRSVQESAEVRYYTWGTERYTYSSTPTTYRFTGQRYEAGIGLYYYNARWYDDALGRFVQADTIIPQQQGVQAWDR